MRNSSCPCVAASQTPGRSFELRSDLSPATFICPTVLLSYLLAWRSKSTQLTHHPTPYRHHTTPPSAPASVWVCGRLIALTSGITPSHSAVPTGSPQKGKKTLFTQTTKEENRLLSHTTRRKKHTLYLPPNFSGCAKQSKVLPPRLPPLFPSASCSAFFCSDIHLQWRYSIRCRKWTQVRKMWGFFLSQSCC